MRLKSWSGNLKVRHHFRELQWDGRTKEDLDIDVSCIHLPKDSDKLQAVVNTAMNLLVPVRAESDNHLLNSKNLNNNNNISWRIWQKITVICYVTRCRFVNRYLCFGVIVCLLLQERKGTFLIAFIFYPPVTFSFLGSNILVNILFSQRIIVEQPGNAQCSLHKQKTC